MASMSNQIPSSHVSFLSGSAYTWKYHVFLSFKDEDNDFVSHLYTKLNFEGIHTVKLGEKEKVERLEAIQESRFLVLVLSESYASCTWCLDELVKIIDCLEKTGKMVIPIFYNVVPDDLRNQRGRIAVAFKKHEENFKEEIEKVKKWKGALTKVGSICGWNSCHWEAETIFIEQVVGDISDKLIYTSSSETSDLVGIGSHISEMEKKLCLESYAVHMLGIWGMGGIGKTTIAKVIYDMHSSQFEAHCFLANVKDSFREHGAAALQEILLSNNILEKRSQNTWTSNASYSAIKRRFCRKRVLLVLDDVDDWKQLEALAGEPNWFGPGSRIIITTRDKHLLDAHGVKSVYEVQLLETDQALQLFSQHAFKAIDIKIEYLELSKQLISHAKGLPLALKVLGSFLKDTSIFKWQKVKEKLAVIPDSKIHDVLRISFDGLDDTQRDVFLDIACFFNGKNKEFVRDILDGCGFFPDIAFAVLEDKALVTISDNKLLMHDLLQEMGHAIVRQESKEQPGKCSRLWIPDDIYQVLTKNMGTNAVEGIFLNMSKVQEMHLISEAFAKMQSLRLLKFYDTGSKNKSTVYLSDQGLHSISNKLRLLHWEGYPSKSLPSSFHAENLVELNLIASNVEQLWSGVQHLVNLKRIDLSYCRYLTTIPDLCKAQSLERLELGTCRNLVEVSSSIQHLNKLVFLNLGDCTNLMSLSGGIHLKSLKALLLTSCSRLTELPEILGDVQYLCLSGTAIERLPQSIGSLSSLVNFSLKNCTGLKTLPDSITRLTSLSGLFLAGCSNITKFPEIPENVESLDLSGTAIEELPSLLCSCSRLSALKLSNCTRLKSLPSSICRLVCLRTLCLSGCLELESLHDLKSLPWLQRLDLSNCNLSEFPSNLGNLSSLEDLDLSINNFESVPASIKHLSQLKLLNVSHCKRLRYFPDVPPHIKVLRACHCTSLETVPRTKSLWEPNVECWNFANCFKLDRKEASNIVEDAQLSINFMATASKQDNKNKGQRSQFCFPGSEIPEWFLSRDTGSSLTLMLPPHGHQLMGIAFGALVVCENPFIIRSVCCKCHFKATKGEQDDRIFISHYWSGNHKDTALSSDNIFFWFISWETRSVRRGDVFDEYYEASFKFSASDHSKNAINVKKSGVHLLYSKESHKNLLNVVDKNFHITILDSGDSMRGDGNSKRGREHCGSGRCDNEEEKSNHKRIKRCSF